jgi:polyphosphate kinase
MTNPEPVSAPPPAISLTDPALYINRELSWLEFNRRCLTEAFNPDLPLLERLRFLTIFSNNLDEFFMVRVSGLKDQVAAGITDTTPDGLTPQQVLERLRERVMPMLHEQRICLYNDLLPKLAEQGIFVLGYEQLTDEDRRVLRHYFEAQIFPILTPLAVDTSRPFPHISNLSLNLAVEIADKDGQIMFARLKVPNSVPRVVSLNAAHKQYGIEPTAPDMHRFVWLEALIIANLELLFPGMKVISASAFRVTRNNDLEIAEEEASDLLETIEDIVRQRRFGPVVRLDVVDTMPETVRTLLIENFEITSSDVYVLRAPLGMKDLTDLLGIDAPALKFAAYVPHRPALLAAGSDIFAAIRADDILLHHPYDSFLPTIEFFQMAANDPNVLAIKTTLYRTGSKSPIIEALLQAQENLKQVAVLVELKARFDEENNISWARALEASGVHVVYGLVGLKTHAKITLVVRREADGVRRYVHLSTGNYNAGTARVYTDLALFTCDPDIADDASQLFNRLTGYATNVAYKKLLIAPDYVRPGLVSRVRREIDHAKAGRKAHLVFKMNALVDPSMIALLYEASMAGVKIDLLVRGVCALRPGVPGVSDNITVRCLIGRFLEHARVFYFYNNGHHDGEGEVLLGSADLMQRNLNRRVEVVFPVESAALRRRIMNEIVGIEMRDSLRARRLLPDGSYERILPPAGEEPLDAQKWLMEHSRDR